ncbi:hypothetical protein [Cryobacterium psychrophilum]|uniref:Uncharacterized protein n=1 Tax=Cryobacterium psychrophilum TaxID=41988 RepID=A0A4Y8KRB6_9MICO|nr:hypothetical protein [Cryobacterium psychrophilum]TDW29941.1 hypothetical protein EDD25_1667 [Cryobacterium psychrophilum]TFD76505.1 hypothetical protein E3T53_13570 [Cryobacterium psychrophilum]
MTPVTEGTKPRRRSDDVTVVRSGPDARRLRPIYPKNTGPKGRRYVNLNDAEEFNRYLMERSAQAERSPR